MKEIYEISLEEFRKDLINGERNYQLLGTDEHYASELVQQVKNCEESGNNLALAQDIFNRSTKNHHQAIVLTSFCDGNTVPRDILYQYRDCFEDPDAVFLKK